MHYCNYLYPIEKNLFLNIKLGITILNIFEHLEEKRTKIVKNCVKNFMLASSNVSREYSLQATVYSMYIVL